MYRLLLTASALLLFLGDAHGQSFLGRDSNSWWRQLTDSADAKARRSAAFALGKIGGARHIEPLIRTLQKDADPKVKEAAAFALGEIGLDDNNAIAALRDTVGNGGENVLVRRSAAIALGLIGRPAGGALNALEQALNDGDPALKQNVAWALGRISDDSAAALERALRDGDALVKRDAANSLSKIDPSKARTTFPALLECCENGNSELRKSVLGTLSKMLTAKDTTAIAPLQRCLEDKDRDVRIGAALALANIGGREAANAALPTLTTALQSDDIGLRRQAAAVLRNFGESAMPLLPTLKEALTDPDEELRANAALAIGGMGQIASSAIPDLVNRIADSKEAAKVRTEAANALSRMGTPSAAVSAVPKLLKVLGDTRESPKVRERILWALRVHTDNLPNLNVFPTFEKVLDEPLPRDAKMLRYDCAYMLGVLQGPETSKKTLKVLHEWVQDGTILIYTGTTVGGDRTTIEGKSDGGATVREVGSSDGRIMVVQALEQIGVQKAVADFPAIREQLLTLAAANNLDPDLKKGVDRLIKGLK